MKRREFITLLGGAATTWPDTVRAQHTGPMRLIGVLMSSAESDPAAQSEVAALAPNRNRPLLCLKRHKSSSSGMVFRPYNGSRNRRW
jgi:hypothetical protein